ncbi:MULTISPECIES: nitric-oxide reductase large subunit [Stenotrophomonas]|uniref:Nitric oxide reductase large subunit n=1 Tax=Stenotrophomonas nitritireducens TaxID=83617 RepID=A0ABR5NJG2_9GAMM|nr:MULTISPECIES: nitric-oxide reductase large subunit [Stenotrophomonas]KQO00569.1 nitric oxide reductase large subunit [Stenotrophomonas sp. Leaf70]KRG56973.1 nitric oxide reductase large subunit [Stenotrophomonas nitritireducens]
MNSTRKLWVGLAALLIASFAVLLWVGSEVHRQAPPLPDRVVTEDGRVIYTRKDIETGRQVWQSIGGQQLGSIWGHGGYVAPDWGADWLHREAEAVLDIWARREAGAENHKALDEATQAAYTKRVQNLMRPNTYDAVDGTITVDNDRAEAMATVAAHYESLFSADPATAGLREAYAMRNDTVPDAEHRRELTAFYWWAAWASVTERPGSDITYTANWPADSLVGNTAPPSTFIWTVFSVLFLIAGVALLGWHYAVSHGDEMAPVLPKTDPLAAIKITPSMRATAKYFWVVIALFLTQILLGAITAHYQIEGQQAYGFALSDVLPYSLTRTWHTQLAVLWIATAWLGMGLYIAPAISGHEPKFQRLGVNFLWVCLIVIVVGAFAGQWFAVMQKLGLKYNFWFGHQGWEYVDLGRFWQWFLFIGLMLWLTLVGRALWPAIRNGGESKSIVSLLFLSVVAIGLFYAAGLMWGEHTHLSMVEYWRWWVVHLWVEGFFEVFAVAVIAFLFTRLGMLQVKSATVAVLFATIVFMAGGVLGTLHHLYFAGTPTAVIALGASFSALEVVPLAYVGFEAYHNYRMGKATPWMAKYKWPILFFIAVSFWNLVGAGLFGFLINPPLSLYYMQGLNLTPTHGHTALFGVYGMLGIGLMLFCLRGLKPNVVWNEKLLKAAFWALNLGLAGMAAFTLLPLGILQLSAALKHGYWYARSAEFMQQPIVDMLVWMRVPSDTLFSVGALALAWFVFRLWVAPKKAALPVGETDQA